MPRNVEIKAKVDNFDILTERAKKISGSDAIFIKQNDTFFHSKQGRLKLREFPGDESKEAELIQYNRPDTDGPKISSFVRVPINEPALLKEALTLSNEILGKVNKVRYLFLVGQTRIHVDRVEGLGDFMELEVCLRDEQTLEEGQKIAEDLMEQLGIEEAHLVKGAYMDAILEG